MRAEEAQKERDVVYVHVQKPKEPKMLGKLQNMKQAAKHC